MTQPFQCNPQPEIQETHRTTQTNTTTHCRTQRRNQFAHETTPAAPAAHTRYLSSSPAATLYGKTQGFVLRLPPHKIAHATLTQPFQSDPQPEIQETHRTTQTDTTTRCRTQRRNQFAHETTPAAPAAHTRYLASSPAATLHGKTQGFVLRLPPHKVAHATLTQPFQCHPQPEIQETHRTTQTNTTTRCRTQRRNQFAHETTPAAPAAHTRYLSSPAAATLHGKTQGFVLQLPPQHKADATSSLTFFTTSLLHHFPSSPLPFFTTSLPHHFPSSPLPFIITSQCNPQPEIQETHRTTQTNTTTRCRTQRRNQFAHETTPAAPAAHTRYLSSSPAATLYGKTQGFVLRLPPHKIAHATLTQPFQSDPQPEIQETHRTTQTDTTTRCRTQRRNQFAHETTPAAPAAHTRYLASSPAATLHGKTHGFVLRLPPHKIAHATLTQPFQCDPPPEIQETHRTTQTHTTTRCRTQRRNQFAQETTPAAPAAHTRYLSSSPAATLYGKTQGFVLRLPPHKIAHATLTQPFQSDPQPEIQETHRTTQTDTTTRCRTQRRNQFAHETTPAAPAAHTRYLASSPAATLHGKTHGFVLRLPPHKIAHATLTQPFQCDPQPEIQETHRTTQTHTTTRCRTQRRNQFAHETTPAAPAAHTRYLASSPAATLHGKTQGFVLRLPPHKVAHATLTQPFQCDPQPCRDSRNA